MLSALVTANLQRWLKVELNDPWQVGISRQASESQPISYNLMLLKVSQSTEHRSTHLKSLDFIPCPPCLDKQCLMSVPYSSPFIIDEVINLSIFSFFFFFPTEVWSLYHPYLIVQLSSYQAIASQNTEIMLHSSLFYIYVPTYIF